jgi:hypothetical protein
VTHPATDGPATAPDAPVIVSNDPGGYPWGVLAKRHPALIERVRDAHPYAPAQRRALDALLAEATGGTIRPLPPDAHDHAAWERWGLAEQAGRSWFDAPFLWAESYFYRRLLGAVDYFTPGSPWRGIDPFAPAKRAELHGPAVDDALDALDALAARPADERATALLHAALWGNRADLGFLTTAHPATPAHELVADDSATLWSLLTPGTPRTVSVIADNAGPELIPDLLLIDHLLRHGHAHTVHLHLKPHPYYVSDATMADLIEALDRLAGAPGRAAAEAAERLRHALRTDSLRPETHPFSCAPLPYADMPAELRRRLASSALTVLKGDLNYRRLVGDRLWPPDTPFAERTAYFPTPVAALRTLKSDVITGIPPHRAAALDATGHAWRTSGTHALIQARP